MNSATVQLAMDLMARESVTPEDAGCQDVMIARLEALGFEIHRLRFDDVDNFWAQRGSTKPLVAFAAFSFCPGQCIFFVCFRVEEHRKIWAQQTCIH